METLKRWAKRIVHAPEDPVPTVDSKEWVKSHFDEGPKNAVRSFSIQYFTSFTNLPPGPSLLQEALSFCSVGA
jgi:hypothetical protein